MKYKTLAIADPAKLIYGRAPRPIKTRRGMCIGGGLIYPELNFTLPDINIRKEAMPEIVRHYQQIVTEALERAAELEAPGVMLEFETLPPMTEHPALGMEVVNILLEGIEDAHDK